MVNRAPLTGVDQAYLVRRKEQGVSHRQVAQELGCSVETVRKHWRGHRRGIEPRPRGRPAQGVLSQYPAALRQQAIALKQAHPHWGPAVVRLELSQQLGCPLSELPSRSRLAVLFKTACPAAVQPRKPKVVVAAPPPSLAVHQRWQIDAVEKIPLAEGQFATVLQIRDPVGALMIASRAFLTTQSPTTWRKLTLLEVRTVVREAMARWGCPAEIQTDHEGVFVGSAQGDFPPPLTLWLAGLGIRHHFSRTGQPTDQAQVERSHRTVGDLSWKDQTYASLSDLQRALDRSCQRYNQELPVQAGHCQGEVPLQKAPWATTTGRPFDPAREDQLFQLAWVDQLLVGQSFRRRIDQTGVLWLGSRKYYFPRPYRNQWATAQFVPETRSFMFTTDQGQEIALLPAQGLSVADLIGPLPVVFPSSVAFQLPLPWEGVRFYETVKVRLYKT